MIEQITEGYDLEKIVRDVERISAYHSYSFPYEENSLRDALKILRALRDKKNTVED